MQKQERLPKDVYFLVRYTNAVEIGNTTKADYYRGRLEQLGFKVPVLIKTENTVLSEFEFKQRTLINTLLKMNDKPIGNIMTNMERQTKLMNSLNKNAFDNDNTKLGRIVKTQYADSYAYYVITKVLPTKVKVEWIDFCDGWQNDWGTGTWIDSEEK